MEPLKRARLSLVGLSVGDAFGETFFTAHDVILQRVRSREPAPGPWHWTDDTAMALSVVEELAARGTIDQDSLAHRFAMQHEQDPARGYGGGAHELLSRIAAGEPWRTVARRLFRGAGSFGNGAAMRVAPLGGYFADDLDRACDEAVRSAEVTHAHPEGIAGAVGVAVAAGELWQTRERAWDRASFFQAVIERMPAGYTRDGVEEASAIPRETSVVEAARALGNGTGVSAPDTVPFALWCSSRAPDSYEDSLWTTAMGLGDVDTTCAIVGGLVVLRSGLGAIPPAWISRREPLPSPSP